MKLGILLFLCHSMGRLLCAAEVSFTVLDHNGQVVPSEIGLIRSADPSIRVVHSSRAVSAQLKPGIYHYMLLVRRVESQRGTCMLDSVSGSVYVPPNASALEHVAFIACNDEVDGPRLARRLKVGGLPAGVAVKWLRLINVNLPDQQGTFRLEQNQLLVNRPFLSGRYFVALFSSTGVVELTAGTITGDELNIHTKLSSSPAK